MIVELCDKCKKEIKNMQPIRYNKPCLCDKCEKEYLKWLKG